MAKRIFSSDEMGLFWTKMKFCSHLSKAEAIASRFKVTKDRIE
jgi:hypothetical protein